MQLADLDIKRAYQAVMLAASKLNDGSIPVGADCVLYALLGRALLSDVLQMQDVRAVAGAAAWRIGPAAGDCVLHAPVRGLMQHSLLAMGQGIAALPLHAWVEVQGWILDMTTWQLPVKAKALQEIDGVVTNCVWSPDWVLTRRCDVSVDINDAVNAEQPPAMAYHAAPEKLSSVFLNGLPGRDLEADHARRVMAIKQAWHRTSPSTQTAAAKEKEEVAA